MAGPGPFHRNAVTPSPPAYSGENWLDRVLPPHPWNPAPERYPRPPRRLDLDNIISHGHVIDPEGFQLAQHYLRELPPVQAETGEQFTPQEWLQMNNPPWRTEVVPANPWRTEVIRPNLLEPWASN